MDRHCGHYSGHRDGAVHYDDKNYKCKDTAAVKDLLTQVQSWELYHESAP